MLLGQMEPGILSTNPVSESGNVVAAFLMFWSDVDVMVDQHHLFPGERLSLSRSHSHTKITYMQGFLFSHTVAPSSFSSTWFQMATSCPISQADGQRYVRRCLDSHAAVPTASHKAFV